MEFFMIIMMELYNIIPVDVQGNIMTFSNFRFFRKFNKILILQLQKENIYTQSIYNSGNVKFSVNLVPLIPGKYKLYMSNGNEKIKNIPIEIIVLIGDVSEVYSIITNINSPFRVKAGISFNFQIDLYDVMNNKFSSQPTDEPEITIISKLENSDNYPSPLGILDLNLNLANEYAGNSQSNFDGTYILKAGTYKMYIYK